MHTRDRLIASPILKTLPSLHVVLNERSPNLLSIARFNRAMRHKRSNIWTHTPTERNHSWIDIVLL